MHSESIEEIIFCMAFTLGKYTSNKKATYLSRFNMNIFLLKDRTIGNRLKWLVRSK